MSREIANFMHLYPAYKLEDVLNLYAITFHVLLGEGYKDRNRQRLMLYNLVRSALTSGDDVDDFLKQLEWAGKDVDDILDAEGGGASSPSDIKKLLQGK